MSEEKDMSIGAICGIIGIVVAVMAAPIYFSHRDIQESRAERKVRETACNSLDVKMYGAVKVKNYKFYEDEVFYAIKKFSETVEVKRPFDENEKNNLRFLCSDLEKTEDPYKEVFH